MAISSRPKAFSPVADDDLSRLDDWFGRILHGLEPGQRRKAALKLGQALRRSNLKRVEANVNPDGSAMEARKPRKDARGRLRKKAGGKMFQGLRFARHWRIDGNQDGVSITANSPLVDRTAAVSQFGEVATVGRLRSGKPIRYRYPERRLLGFGPEDEDLALQVASDMISPDQE